MRDATSSYLHVEKAKAYIEKAYHYDISLGDVAGKLGLTPSYFCHLFSLKCGVTFVDYVNGIRIEKAKGLLRNTDLRLYEIAERVGFHSQDYFYRVFKKFEGICPREWRYRSKGI